MKGKGEVGTELFPILVEQRVPHYTAIVSLICLLTETENVCVGEGGGNGGMRQKERVGAELIPIIV